MRKKRHYKLWDRRGARWVRPTEAEADAMDAEVAATYTERTCEWGHCVTLYDGKGRPTTGTGLAFCPCGWVNHAFERRAGMQARPRTPVKPVGRHGSRVQRSKIRWGQAQARAKRFAKVDVDVLQAPGPREFIVRPITL
jgi:hypothetical protein